MVDPTSARSSHSTTLRNKFELEKHRLSYTDYHRDVKKRLNMAASPSNHTGKHPIGYQDEIIRHMSNLPSYLETGRATPDRALSFGVMDWGRLEKWQYQHLKCSPSTSNSSPLFSTDGSTPQSTGGQRCSPAGQKHHRLTLQSHFNISSCPGNADNFQDSKDARFYHCTEKKIEQKNHKMIDFYPTKLHEYESSIDMGNYQTKSASLKGKMKIQETSYRTWDLDQAESHKTVIRSPNVSGNGETNGKDSVRANHRFSEKRSSFSSKNSAQNNGTFAASKLRSMSPIRRFSFSSTKRAESPVSRKSTTDNNTFVSNCSHSSPLRRLFEPLFLLKATNSHQATENPREDSKLKAKSNLELRNCRGVISGDNLCRNERTQALFQTSIKNGRPLFTFAVENNSNILAATVRDLSSTKENINCWVYTFFTVDEIKKKNRSWLLSPSKKEKSHGYVPNVTAQMTVSNRLVTNSENREFSLVRVDPSQLDELAAIVVKFSRYVKDDYDEENQDRFNMTVILPGGNHGKSSDGKPSPLIERWRSSGVCDCGGWDLGCRLRTLTNQVPSSRISDSPSGQFELFFQGDVINERRFFGLCPLKEGMYSVEYNSSLSPLQALSICISVVECRRSSQHTERTTTAYVAKQVKDDPNPVRYASFPSLSPVGRV